MEPQSAHCSRLWCIKNYSHKTVHKLYTQSTVLNSTIRCLRHRGSHDTAWTFAGILRSRQLCTQLVPVLPVWSVSVCPLWWKLVDSNSADMWSPTRIGPWTILFLLHMADLLRLIHVHSLDPTSMLMTLRFMVSASEPCFCLYQWCSRVDENQPTATQCRQNRDYNLVHIITSPASDTNWFVCHRRWRHHTHLISARPGY